MKAFLTALIILFSISLYAVEKGIIAVTGTAEKSLDPDYVNLNVEVWSKAPTAKQAQLLSAKQFSSVKKTIEEFKINKQDIRTENYSLNPEYKYDEKSQQNKMIGFRVNHNILITLRKIENAGLFLDALITERKSTESGVNLGSLHWDSEKRIHIETTLLGEAVRSAKLKAEEIAKAANVKIKAVSRISHTSEGNIKPQPVYATYALKESSLDASSTELSTGQIKVRVDVTAEYQVE